MERFAFFTDLPALDAPATDRPDAGGPVSRVQLFKTGRFRHPVYGRSTITRATYDQFIQNFHEVSGGEIPVDFDHAPEYTGDTRACGWIRQLHPDGDRLWGTVEWTPAGAQAVRDREYRYLSPTFSLSYVGDDETKRGPVIIGAALTNRAFLERMAPVCLSRTPPAGLELAAEEPPAAFAVTDKPWDGSASRFTDEQWRRSCLLDRGDSYDTAKTRYGLPVREPNGDLNRNAVHAAAGRIGQAQASPDALAAARRRLRGCYRELGEDPPDSVMSNPRGAPDSRGAMADYARIAPLLKLQPDADEAAVMSAITTLVAQSEHAIPDGHVAVLATRLADLEAKQKVPAGHVVVAAARFQELEKQEGDADGLRKQLSELQFEQAFSVAVAEARATPAEKEYFRQLFSLDSQLARDMLRDRLPVVITAARGSTGRVPSGEAPDGVDPESYDLDRQVQAYMRDKGLARDRYAEALDAVLAREEMR